jgi:hypothetical protein
VVLANVGHGLTLLEMGKLEHCPEGSPYGQIRGAINRKRPLLLLNG